MGPKELPNFISLLEKHFEGTPFALFLSRWEDVLYSVLAGLFLVGVTAFATRRMSPVPGRLQSGAEVVFGGVDQLLTDIMGPQGRRYTPFLGTLFLYILTMNLMGFLPFLKAPTSNLSTTFALALCVFVYVQITSFTSLGVRGYMDHLMGKPRGAIAWSIILPLFIFAIHLISEFVRPLTLSLRLRSNIWGDDMIMAIFTGFGWKALPMLFFNSVVALLAAFVQAFVFMVLSAIYFALVLVHEEE
jgi:F-type H+-transporting ATPase subunit a